TSRSRPPPNSTLFPYTTLFRSLQVQFDADERRFSEELQQILWLMGLADEPLVLLIGDHDNALLVPAGDQLRSLGAGAAKEFAKARLGGLQLPAGLRARLSQELE